MKRPTLGEKLVPFPVTVNKIEGAVTQREFIIPPEDIMSQGTQSSESFSESQFSSLQNPNKREQFPQERLLNFFPHLQCWWSCQPSHKHGKKPSSGRSSFWEIFLISIFFVFLLFQFCWSFKLQVIFVDFCFFFFFSFLFLFSFSFSFFTFSYFFFSKFWMELLKLLLKKDMNKLFKFYWKKENQMFILWVRSFSWFFFFFIFFFFFSLSLIFLFFLNVKGMEELLFIYCCSKWTWTNCSNFIRKRKTKCWSWRGSFVDCFLFSFSFLSFSFFFTFFFTFYFFLFKVWRETPLFIAAYKMDINELFNFYWKKEKQMLIFQMGLFYWLLILFLFLFFSLTFLWYFEFVGWFLFSCLFPFFFFLFHCFVKNIFIISLSHFSLFFFLFQRKRSIVW